MFNREEPTVSTCINLRAAAATLAALVALAATAVDATAAAKAGTANGRPGAASTTSKIQAAPTNPSSKQQRQKCTQWTARLQAAAGFTLKIEGTASAAQPSAEVEAIADRAMDDGCMVIY